MKIISNFLFILLVVLCSCGNQVQSDPNIIPQPKLITAGNGSFNLGKEVNISISSESLVGDAEFLAGHLSRRFGLIANVLPEGDSTGKITLGLDSVIPHSEGYNLISDESGVVITGQSTDGVFYGIQTLLQLLPLEGRPLVPALEISDEPRFSWRGMHLDVCRHFFEVDFIKKTLDAMAMHKLNTFHWHLTEDQGWRIEIKKYPKLSEIAAWRDETLVGHHHGDQESYTYDGEKHGGFYTHEQIKEVVDHAKMLHITVVPEIEMPGHSEAAIAAYPELSCFNKSDGVAKRWGVYENVYCAGKETTFEFLENVLSEVVELFPSEYIHIGGDECPKTHWKTCPDCQRRMKEEGLSDEHELQSYFIGRIEKYLNSKGKKIIGWDDILEGGLAENAAVMSWRGEAGGITAANMGHNVVMTPKYKCYFDYYQSKSPEEPLAICCYTPIHTVYEYDPMPEKIDPDKRHFILGIQANVWTEYMPTSSHVEYMVFPRLCAMSEVQWTNPENKNYEDFLSRMQTHYKRLSAAGINYRAPLPEDLVPDVPVDAVAADTVATVDAADSVVTE